MLIAGAFWLANEVAAHPGHGRTEEESDPAGPLPRLKEFATGGGIQILADCRRFGIQRAWNKQRGTEACWDSNRDCHREGKGV